MKNVIYKIAVYKDGFICCVMHNNELFGSVFEAKNHEQVFAWLRLVSGSYPGTYLNGEPA